MRAGLRRVRPSLSSFKSEARLDVADSFSLARSEHFIIPFASYPYYLALDALTNKGVADTSRVTKSSCAWLVSDVLLDNFNRAPSILSEVVHDALAVVLGTKARKEPLLQPYVCKRGDVKLGCAS